MKGSKLYGKKLPGLQCDGYENMEDGKSKSSPFQGKLKDIINPEKRKEQLTSKLSKLRKPKLGNVR